MKTPIEQQTELIRSLMRRSLYDHSVSSFTLIETHISWIILAGEYAYKIKKACDLGFLDFSTLQQRQYYCNEELRLNRRLAAPIYLGVVPITGTVKQPVLCGEGEAIEYAVKMVQFPQNAQLDRLLTLGKLENRHIDTFAHVIAGFHSKADFAPDDTHFGGADHVRQDITRVIAKIRQQSVAAHYAEPIDALEQWCQCACTKLTPVFEQRKRDGFVRECHGDMHLRNLVWFNEQPLAFDCLEFDPELRWIDCLSEIAFVVMDLDNRKQQRLANRFLNAYLEQTGDYGGLPVFRFYLVYRALVRAMVDSIRIGQTDISRNEKNAATQEFNGYLQLALSYCQPSTPVLIVTHGPSASGKSTFTQPLLEQTGAIRIRSDVERKRLFGLFGLRHARRKKTGNKETGVTIPNEDETPTTETLYSRAATVQTYALLKDLANSILDSGFSVIVDAVFLHYDERAAFMALARQKHLPYVILVFTTDPDTLRQRIRQRRNDVSDADLAVLEMQLKQLKPLQPDERQYQVIVDTESDCDISALVEDIVRQK